MGRHRLLALCVFVLGLAVLARAAEAECPMDLGRGTGWVIFSAHHMIAFRPDPLHIEIGAPVALVMNVCTKDGDAAELLGVEVQPVEEQPVDGQPAEGARRGTPPSPQHLALSGGGEGRYRAEGLSLPAAGHWEILFDVRSRGEGEQLSHEIVVE